MVRPCRVSQRAPRSCRRCSKRRIRCSKTIPCSQCVAKGLSLECRREEVILSKTLSRTSNQSDTSPVALESAGNTDRTSAVQSHLHSGPVANAVSALERVTWGSYSADTHLAAPTPLLAQFHLLAPDQEYHILRFQQTTLAWMHNVVCFQTFMQECRNAREDGMEMGTAWGSVYFALMSTGLCYMNSVQHKAIGIHDGYALARNIYQKALDMLQASDLMANHSLLSLQCICILSSCAYKYGEGKRMICLLSVATTIAQLMNLHQMGPDPPAYSSKQELVSREVKKRTWRFLCVQDAYLIGSKGCSGIQMNRCSTPIPIDLLDEGHHLDDQGRPFAFDPLTPSPTHTSYMLFQDSLLNIYRTLHDHLCHRLKGHPSLGTIYELILKADAELSQLRSTFPYWVKAHLTTSEGFCPSSSTSSLTPLAIAQIRACRVSFLHMRLKIHRAFFCRGLSDKQYYYSYVTCLNSAIFILKECSSAPEFLEPEVAVPDIWTVAPHAISASIIITLSSIYSPLPQLQDGFGSEHASATPEDRRLMFDCLTRLSAVEEPSQIVNRGVAMIHRLLVHEPTPDELAQGQKQGYGSLGSNDVVRLMNEIEETLLSRSRAFVPQQQVDLEEVISFLDFSPGLDDWLLQCPE